MSKEDIKNAEVIKPVVEGGSQNFKEVLNDVNENISTTDTSSSVLEYSGANEGDKAEFGKVIEESNSAIIRLKSETEEKLHDLENEEGNVDPFDKWKKREAKKIQDRAKEMKGQTRGSGTGVGEVSVFDEKLAGITLGEYGELRFIEYASEEGDGNDVDYALKMLDTYYKDRDDLRAGLYINKGNFDEAKKIIVNTKDRDLYANIGRLLSSEKLNKNNPTFKNGIIKELETSNPKYYKDLIDTMKVFKPKTAA